MKKRKPGPPRGQKHAEVQRSAFGERLFRARKARGLSQEELGKKVGLSKRMISRYEGTYPGPPLEVLEGIAQALNVTASYLIGESPLKSPIQDEMTPTFRRYIDILKELPADDKKTALKMIEALAAKSELTRKGNKHVSHRNELPPDNDR